MNFKFKSQKSRRGLSGSALKIAAVSLILTFGYFVTVAMKKPTFNKEQSLTNGNYALRVTYDTEINTRFDTDGNLTNPLDIAAQTPTVEKQGVIIEISPDGKVFMQMTEMQPSWSLNVPNNTLESNLPQPHKTIISGGKMQIYDKKGTLLFTEDFDLPNVSAELAMLKDMQTKHGAAVINQVLNQGKASLIVGDLLDYIENAAQYGIDVTELNENLVMMRVPITEGEAANHVTVSIIDKVKNLIFASRLYDAEDNLLGSTAYQYTEGAFPILKAVQERTPMTLPSGLPTVMEVYTTYEKVAYDLKLD